MGHVARTGEKRNAYRVLMGKPEVKRPLGRTGRLEGEIKTYSKRVNGSAWTGLSWLRIRTNDGLL